MAASVFETIPVAIREQMYDKLLTFSTTQSTAKERAPSSAVCSLLSLNRQIYTEMVKFVKDQLPVLITTNDPKFVEKFLKDRKGVPIISQLRSETGAISKQITESLVSFEVEMYVYHNQLDATSFNAFLLPAKSSKELVTCIWSPLWSIWTMQASISFKLRNDFSHTQEVALSKLVQPWTKRFDTQPFVGVSTRPAIPSELWLQLKKRLLGDYAASGHLQKFLNLARGAQEKMQVRDWIGAAERWSMAERYTRIVWNCHLGCMKRESEGNNRGDLVTHLWLNSTEATAHRLQCLINAALGLIEPINRLEVQTKSGDEKVFREACIVAEMGIRFLRTLPKGNNDGIELEEDPRIRRAKAQLSFRAHLACKGLGDVSAAIEYLQEATRYEPESGGALAPKLHALQDEAAKKSKHEGARVAILWGDH